MKGSCRSSTRCAAPRRLLSNNPAYLIFGVVFAVGAVMFATGSLLVRRTREGPQPETIQMLEPIDGGGNASPWTAELARSNELPALDVRIEMIERLAMIGETWSVSTLERARAHDPDAHVREAAENALIVIAARS